MVKKKLVKPLKACVPEGDVRLVVNISKDHHRRLKVIAAKRGTTMGALIEELIARLP